MAQSRRAVMPRVPVQGAGHVDVEGVQVRRRGELDGAAAAGAAPALGRLGPRCPTPPASQRSPRGAAPEHPRCRQQMRQQQMRGEMLARTGSGRRGAGAGRLADAGVVGGGSKDEGRRMRMLMSVRTGSGRRGAGAGRLADAGVVGGSRDEGRRMRMLRSDGTVRKESGRRKMRLMGSEMLARTGSGRRGAGAGRLADAGVVGGSRDEGRRTVSVGGGGARRGVRAGRGVLDGGGRGRPPRGTRLPGPW